MTSTDAVAVARQKPKTFEELREENQKLRELVVDLSRIIARSVVDDQKK